MFTVKGLLNNNLVTVNWENGVISSSDPVLSFLITKKAKASEGKNVSLIQMPVRARTNLIQDPHAMMAIITDFLDRVLETTGDIPVFEFPKDTIV